MYHDKILIEGGLQRFPDSLDDGRTTIRLLKPKYCDKILINYQLVDCGVFKRQFCCTASAPSQLVYLKNAILTFLNRLNENFDW